MASAFLRWPRPLSPIALAFARLSAGRAARLPAPSGLKAGWNFDQPIIRSCTPLLWRGAGGEVNIILQGVL